MARRQYTNPPRRLPADLYDEALDAYVRRVRHRTLAIYRVGSFTHPGLSDIDLLLVPCTRRFDNGLCFELRFALPEALRAPFRSAPFIVPAETVDAIRYTTHSKRTLVAGEDVAADVEIDRSPEQRWSMLFERLSQFEHLREEMDREARVDLWKLIARAKSVSYSLSDVDRLTGSSLAPPFAADVEALRSSFFEMPEDEAGQRTEALFCAGLETIRSQVAGHLGIGNEREVGRFGCGFLLGQQSIPGLDEAALRERRKTVSRLQTMTRVYGCKKGDLFARPAYRARVAALDREHRPSWPVRTTAKFAYRMRARFL